MQRAQVDNFSKKQKLLLALTLIIFLFAAGQADEVSLDSALASIKSQYSLVGMSVVVTKGDSVVYSQGYGKRDIARNLPVDSKTVYRIASISKSISALALMQLYSQGLFELDDDVSKHLGFTLKNPHFPTQIITMEQIISHTSSLRDGSGYSAFLAKSYAQNPPPAISELLTQGANSYTSDMFSNSQSPDSRYFQYANINYGIVGTLVEKLSGKRFDSYCREQILEPLGLNGSFNIQDIENINDVAVLYRKSGINWNPQADNYSGQMPTPRDLSGYEIGSNGLIFGPQGSLRISAQDLAMLMLSFQNNGLVNGVRLLPDSIAIKMKESGWNYNGSNGNNYYGIFNHYGLGLSKTNALLQGENLCGHPGEAYGLVSDMYFSSDEDYGIIFVTNGGLWGNGSYSGWYNVEEAVFTACHNELASLGLTAINRAWPVDFALEPAFPNPFNASVNISFTLSSFSHVTLQIIAVDGRTVDTLIAEPKSAGRYTFVWEPQQSPSGVYFCLLHTENGQRALQKIVLLK
ncbi:MAG TPA: T9SS type A sorting domain-containing protein [Candidatus Marinimicrobia bacterium]|nr:T9SS type A sorting domain-containing protein [Candidatus Neomarinimicrobiota bacterium]